MKSTATQRSWNLLNSLPGEGRELAGKNCSLWMEDPNHPSLHFKRLAGAGEPFSVRVGIHYRAIGWKPSSDSVERAWIGSHADYAAMLKHSK